MLNKKSFKIAYTLIFIATLSLFYEISYAVDRFPRPEFESGHVTPLNTAPLPQSNLIEYLDVGVLLLTLSLASWLALKRRSRKGIYLLTLFSLLYFGFWREGCVCPVGSIQNVTLTLFDATYTIPLVVILFFILPLLFALFFGRTFCAAVCPLGAMQELVLLKPIKVPTWLEKILGLFPYLYLGLAVLFAATGAQFIVCRFDPFVGFWRFGANFNMIIFGVAFLILGVFVGRPYCRFMCPYGVLLGWMSRFAKHHLTITPSICDQCRLCENSCPYGQIEFPTAQLTVENRMKTRRRLVISLIMLPVWIVFGLWAGRAMDVPLSQLHPTVQLAERIKLEDSGQVLGVTEESKAFRTTGTPKDELFTEALTLRQQFRFGGGLLGVFMGCVLGLTLLSTSVRRYRKDYVPNRTGCFSCARCIPYCPIGKDVTSEVKHE